MKGVSARTVGRLSLYRRLLSLLEVRGTGHVFSHSLADMAGVTAAQVRRDIMGLGCSGSPSRGYAVAELLGHINRFLDPPREQAVALVGVGNLGRAILAYFSGRRPMLRIVAAFDRDPHKYGRVILGCRCYAADELPQVVAAQGIRLGILAVPAGAAQAAAEVMVASGLRGLLNFAPLPLRVPSHTYVEDIDMTMSLDKVAYFTR